MDYQIQQSQLPSQLIFSAPSLQPQLIFDSSLQPLEERNFTIDILDDSIYELTESFQVQFSSSDNHVILMTDVITLSITDNEGKWPSTV